MGLVVSPGDVNPVKGVQWIYPHSFGHLRYPLGPESVLGIDVEDLAIESPLIQGQDCIDCELVPDLGLTTAELTVDLYDSLCLETTPE